MRRIWALCLALLLCLCGCSSLLEREYTATAPHEENPPPRGDTAYQVETYPALRSALLSYVEEGMDQGLLRFPTTYAGNLTVDLEKARRQLLEEEPLGCYALEDMTFRTSKIIAYYEAELNFTYRVDPAELASLPRVASREALTRLLAEMLEREDSRLCVYLTACPEEDVAFVSGALESAWAARTAGEEGTAPAGGTEEGEDPPVQERLPQLVTEFYPQFGSRRVAVVELIEPQEEPSRTGPDGEEQDLDGGWPGREED